MQKAILKPDTGSVLHWCEGCDTFHIIPIADPYHIHWKFNGDFDKPTINDASVKHRQPHKGRPDLICHYVIIDGVIQYYDDCSHGLKGQSVPLKPF